MKLNRQDIFDIVDKSKSNFANQKSRLYWKTSGADKEVEYDEKRIISIIEAISSVKQLGLEIDYGE